MANNCCYILKAAGDKENTHKLLDILQYKNDKAFMCRVFSAEADEEETLKDGRTVLTILGDCAWSVYSCMFSGSHTYYNDVKEKQPEVTTLDKQSKLLNLDIELYSTEPGMAFAEHYHIVNGDIVSDECVDYAEYYWDKDEYPTFKAYCDAYEITDMTEDMYDEYGSASIGGFEQTFAIDSLPRA